MTTEELEDFASALNTLQSIAEAMESKGELEPHAKRHFNSAMDKLHVFYNSHRFITAKESVEAYS